MGQRSWTQLFRLTALAGRAAGPLVGWHHHMLKFYIKQPRQYCFWILFAVMAAAIPFPGQRRGQPPWKASPLSQCSKPGCALWHHPRSVRICGWKPRHSKIELGALDLAPAPGCAAPPRLQIDNPHLRASGAALDKGVRLGNPPDPTCG